MADGKTLAMSMDVVACVDCLDRMIHAGRLSSHQNTVALLFCDSLMLTMIYMSSRVYA
jgi:hypothetical protein